MLKRNLLIAATTAAAAAPQLFMAASAVVLEGTCDGPQRCIVNVEGDTISTSRGLQIKSDHVIGWSFVNDANRGGVLFRPRNEDYRILIKYFDDNGKRQLSQIGFFNFKSAQAMVSALELTSGLAPNHDQAGATTKCTAIGKDSGSGTSAGTVPATEAAGALWGTGIGALIGGGLGNVIAPGVGGALGAGIGAAAGQSLEGSSGNFNLKRNVMSEVRMTPATAKPFFDGSFVKRNECIDQPTAPTTNVFVTGPLPLKTSK
ncbi:MAG: hypothetical protein ACO24U_09665 [Prochlorococcaceae cyanobacterium]